MTEYLLAAAAIVGLLIGALATHVVDKAAIATQEARYAAYQTQVAQMQATEARAAAAALEAQAEQAQSKQRENDLALQDLHQKLAAADALRAGERISVERMFQSAAKACRAGSDVPQAGSAAGTAATSSAPSLGQLAVACQDLATEDGGNIAAKDTMTRVIKPQL